ncbi:unnamed protein product [Clavelina lepadiformis]|uniref:Protein kinase domain-containing protein n=1 Tax=Clavelina lepadiformis TaxID=159417 RepID=A0ABP0GL96_CLALP
MRCIDVENQESNTMERNTQDIHDIVHNEGDETLLIYKTPHHQNTLQMPVVQLSNEKPFFETRMEPAALEEKVARQSNKTLFSKSNRSRAKSTPEVSVYSNKDLSTSLSSKKQAKIPMLQVSAKTTKTKPGKLRSMSTPNIKNDISNNRGVDRLVSVDESTDEKSIFPGRMLLPKMDGSNSQNTGLTLQSISRSSTPFGRDDLIDLETPRNRSSVTPTGGRLPYNPFHTPRTSNAMVRLDPLSKKLFPYDPDLQSSDGFPSSQAYMLPSSPLLTVRTKVHYYDNLESLPATPLTARGRRSVLEPLQESSERSLTPNSSTLFEQQQNSKAKATSRQNLVDSLDFIARQSNPNDMYDNFGSLVNAASILDQDVGTNDMDVNSAASHREKENITSNNGVENHISGEQLSPPLIDSTADNTDNNGKVLDFPSLVDEKKNLDVLQVTPSCTKSILLDPRSKTIDNGKSKPRTSSAVLVPGLRAEEFALKHRQTMSSQSLTRKISSNHSSSTSSPVPENFKLSANANSNSSKMYKNTNNLGIQNTNTNNSAKNVVVQADEKVSNHEENSKMETSKVKTFPERTKVDNAQNTKSKNLAKCDDHAIFVSGMTKSKAFLSEDDIMKMIDPPLLILLEQPQHISSEETSKLKHVQENSAAISTKKQVSTNDSVPVDAGNNVIREDKSAASRGDASKDTGKETDFVLPNSLSLYVPDQDVAVKITVNLDDQESKDSSVLKQATKSARNGLSQDKSKAKTKPLSSKAAEATSRLYKSPNNVENKSKSDTKKLPKANKVSVKKEDTKSKAGKASDRNKDTSDQKGLNKAVRNVKEIQFSAKKKKKSAMMPSNSKIGFSNNPKTKDTPNISPHDIIGTSLSQISTNVENENKSSDKKAVHTTIADVKVTKESPCICDNNSPSVNELFIECDTLPKNTPRNENKNSSSLYCDEQSLKSKDTPCIKQDVTSQGKGDVEINNDTMPKEPTQNHRYRKQPVQTPVIVEAFPSPSEEILLSKVAETKPRSLRSGKRASTATGIIRLKKQPKTTTGNKIKKVNTHNKKKTKEDIKFAEIPCKSSAEPRAQSAGLTIEKRNKYYQKSKSRGKKSTYVIEEEDDLLDIDIEKHALISGLSWHVVVPKNETGDHLILKPDNKLVLDQHEAADFSQGSKLSPIPESVTVSIKSVNSDHKDNQTEAVNCISADTVQNTDNIVPINNFGQNDVAPQSQQLHRPTSTASSFSLNVDLIEDSIPATVTQQKKDTHKSNASSIKGNAWDDSEAGHQLIPKEILNEKKFSVSGIAITQAKNEEETCGSPTICDKPVENNSTVSNQDDMLLSEEKSQYDPEDDSSGDESEELDELELLRQELLAPRSELDAHILHKLSSDSEDDSTPDATLNNSSTVQDNDTTMINLTKASNALEESVFLHTHENSPREIVIQDRRRSPDQEINAAFGNEINVLPQEDRCFEISDDDTLCPSTLSSDGRQEFLQHERGMELRRAASVCSISSHDDSEIEMLEHMRRTLHAAESDEMETPRSESECSINIESDLEDRPKPIHRQLTKSALKRHNSNMEDVRDQSRALLESQNSQRSSTSYVTESSVNSIADLNTEKCMGWKKGPMIGQGAYGKVWQGMTHCGQLIAVKQVELSLLNRNDAEKEFENLQREVDILKDMRHPNIVSFIGTNLDGNVVSIFMEFLTGGSISGILRNFGQLHEPVFKRYTRQVLEGVKYLHTRNVVHRDINGNNIMLLPNGIIKLIDFGCSKRMHQRSMSAKNMDDADESITIERQLKSVVGTPYWMAPEVITGQGHGPKSDLWSVGCTVIEMATTNPPLHNLGPMAAMFHIGEGRTMPGLDKSHSKHAQSFVVQCFRFNADERPTAETLLRHKFMRNKRHEKER